MSIIDDVAPYMDVRRFTDASDVSRSFYKATYDNIGQPNVRAGAWEHAEHTVLYPPGGVFRRGSFNEAGIIREVEVFFEPVVAGNLWRGVIRKPDGTVLASSPYKSVTGRAPHKFILGAAYTPAIGEEILVGAEPQDETLTAKAYVNNIPNEALPDSWALDRGTWHRTLPPANYWDGQVVVYAGRAQGHIKRLNPADFSSVKWTFTGSGNIPFAAISPDKTMVATTDGSAGNLVLLNVETGTTIWSSPVSSGPAAAVFSADSTKLYVVRFDRIMVAYDLTAATPPAVIWTSAVVVGNGKMLLSPDELNLYVIDDTADVVRKVRLSDGFVEWSYDPQVGNTHDIALNDSWLYVGNGIYADRIGLDDGVRVDRWNPTGSQCYGVGVTPNDEFLVCAAWSAGVRIELATNVATTQISAYTAGGSANYQYITHVETDGVYTYWSMGDDNQEIRQYTLLGGQIGTYSPGNIANQPTAYTSVIYLTDNQFIDKFTQVTANKLPVRFSREVLYTARTNDGRVLGHRYWPSYIEIPAQARGVRALTTEVLQLVGQTRQVSAEATIDGGATWEPLTLGSRMPLIASAFQVRFVLEPADLIETWETASGSYLPARLEVSQQRWWDNTGSEATRSIISTFSSDGLGKWWRLADVNREGRDGWYNWVHTGDIYGTDGDIEQVIYLANQTYFWAFWKIAGADLGTCWTVRMRHEYVDLLNPAGTLVASASIANLATQHARIRIIWRGNMLVVLRDDQVVLTYSSFSSNGSFFAFNENDVSNILHWHGFRGRGMANGYNGATAGIVGSDLVEIDHASVFYELTA